MSDPVPVAVNAQRRRGLRAWPLLLGAAPLGRLHAAPSTPPPDRFGALQRPALRVRQPERIACQAAAQAGQRLVVVGERGVVLFSDAPDQAWHQAQVPVSVGLNAVVFATERQGWAVGHGGVVLATQDGGQRWQRLADGRVLAQALLAAAQSQQDGTPAASARLRHAQLLVDDGPDKPLLDVQWLPAAPGAAGPGTLVVLGAYGLALASSDDGQHWQALGAAHGGLDNPKGLHLYGAAVRGRDWLLAGEQGLLLHSTDGGAGFARLASPYAGTWFSTLALADGRWLLAGLRGQVWLGAPGQAWQPVAGLPPASVLQAGARPGGGAWLLNQASQVWQLGPEGPETRAQARPLPDLPPLTALLPLPKDRALALTAAGPHLIAWPQP